jgi:hypothetical protein
MAERCQLVVMFSFFIIKIETLPMKIAIEIVGEVNAFS